MRPGQTISERSILALGVQAMLTSLALNTMSHVKTGKTLARRASFLTPAPPVACWGVH